MLLLLLSTASSSFAGSATWQASPATGDWNTATNWMPNTVPNGPSDTATFALSNTTGVSLSADTEVNGIVFNPGASAFTIATSPGFQLTISGVGITNNSGIAQNFVAAVDSNGSNGLIAFTNSATAGSQTSFTNNGGAVSGAEGGVTEFFDISTAGNGSFTTNGGAASGGFGGAARFFRHSSAGNGIFTTKGGAVAGGDRGFTQFFNDSTAGYGTFTNNGSALSGAGGAEMNFFDRSTAGNGTFTNNGAVAGADALGGFIYFFHASTAADSAITNNGSEVSGGGGTTIFSDTSTAGRCTLVADGGLNGGGFIRFDADSSGGTARVAVFGNGNLDISGHGSPGVAVGSIEGNGNVFLGANNLTVGTHNLNTLFSGVIQDGGATGGTGGSLTKIGNGQLVLRHRNTYTGGTTIKHGKLVVNNKGGSGTGSGAVQVDAGTLGGTGVIAGAVTIGDGSGPRAFLSPGFKSDVNPGTLTIQSVLTFNSDASYHSGLNTNTAKADQVVALGVTINSGALFVFTDLGSGTLTPGTVFTIIDNTSATPIAGNFSNLPDGSTFTSNGNTYKVNYEGGTGNDLTLTVQ